jgi:prepilin-type N-terminal cleavage/methylation domain-containing protein
MVEDLSSIFAAAHRKHWCAAIYVSPVQRPALRRGATSPGFTLIELLLVAALLSIIAAIAAPRYAASLTEYRVDSAARRLQADIAGARVAARAQSASVTIEFGPLDYQIPSMPAVDAAGTYKVDLNAGPYRLDGLSPDLGIDEFLRFDGYGTPHTGGTITLRAAGAQRRIIIDPLTGDTAVER